MRRFWPRKFWNRYPMWHFQFIFVGVDSGELRDFKDKANDETQSTHEAKQYLNNKHNEDHVLLVAWKEEIQ